MLVFVTVTAGMLIFTRTHNAQPSDLRDAVAEDFNTTIPVIYSDKANLPVPTIPAAEKNPGVNFHELTRKLSNLEPYVRDVTDNGIRRQIFDAPAALKNGFSEDTVSLAQEMIDSQNEILKAASAGSKNAITAPLDASKYPKLAVFFDMASQQHTIKSTGTLEPCGNWDHPVPNYKPQETNYLCSRCGRELANKGFHSTAGYACGEFSGDLDCWKDDFTRGRGYSGPYGYCDTPRFRDHAHLWTGSYTIQEGEPNPEIATYAWPYWNWGLYVRWWHTTF